MNEMNITFENKTFGSLRAFKQTNDTIWFIANEVCGLLDLDNVSQALSRLSEKEKLYLDEKTQSLIDIEFSNPLNYKELGQRGGWIINESGLYGLTFTSTKETAKLFREWVTSEVLPSIRKTGKYQTSSNLWRSFIGICESGL